MAKIKLEQIEDLNAGGHVIQEEGSDLNQRTNLNFEGNDVTVTDDSENDATVVTIAERQTVPYAHYTISTATNLTGVAGTVVNIPFDGTPVATDDFFTHSTTTNPERVYVTDDCRVEIKATVIAEYNGSNRISLRGRLYVNGVAVDKPRIKSYSRGVSYGDGVMVMVWTEVDLSNGDYFEIRSEVEQRDSSGASSCPIVPDASELIVRRIDTLGGTKGEKGDTGDTGGAPTTTADAGTVIDLSNYLGTMYNQLSPNTNSTFTYTGAVENGWARVLIDTTGKTVFPGLTGGTAVAGHTFAADKIFEMFVEYVGGEARFGFIELYDA